MPPFGLEDFLSGSTSYALGRIEHALVYVVGLTEHRFVSAVGSTGDVFSIRFGAYRTYICFNHLLPKTLTKITETSSFQSGLLTI